MCFKCSGINNLRLFCTSALFKSCFFLLQPIAPFPFKKDQKELRMFSHSSLLQVATLGFCITKFFRAYWAPGSGGRSLTRSQSLLCSVVQHLVNLVVPTKLQRFCPGIRVDKEGTAKASDLLCLVESGMLM